MDLKAAARLRLIGLLVVLLMILLLWLPMVLGEAKLDYSDAIASTIAIGIGLLLIAEVGPAIKTLKAGGVEVEFVDTVTGKFSVLESRVTALERAAKHSARSVAEIRDQPEKPPAKDRPITVDNDPQKGRWGGLATRDSFELTAEFQNVGKTLVEVILKVTAPNLEAAEQAESVEFYLHDTFNPDVVPALFEDRVARLSLIAYGGFTVGVWIARIGIELELDLSKIKGAPRIIRDL